MRWLAPALLVCLSCFAQDLSETEQKALSQALGEAGSSAIEIQRAIETHLTQFPRSPKRAELERLLTKAAMDLRDDTRIILYGERVLAREQDDLQILDRVARSLLIADAKESSERALKYAQRYVQRIGEMRKLPGDPRKGAGQWQDELDRGQSRGLWLQARAIGNLGRIDEAIRLSKEAYAVYPATEAAREVARWLSRSGKDEEAIAYLADAFVLASDAERAGDRARMGELYRKVKGSEKGLGDAILEAYDRTAARASERQAKLSVTDPNLEASSVLDFTLSGVNGAKLSLATLRGKAVVFDFWATWCAPCRAQHPLYEEVKSKYRFNPDVVFLAVSTDEDRSLVEPFLKEQNWTQSVYFEDGMVRKLSIVSIPTTLVINRKGEVSSRLNGYVPNRFVDMLSARIEEALK